ncbi:Ureidoglycolate lyase [Halioglobus japonicus]|nr:Ureidoglycolate lyase [Halioglobus japonicus]
MKIASINKRAVIVTEHGLIDINRASGGKFSSSTDELIPILDSVRAWYETEPPAPTDPRSQAELEADLSQLDPPLTRPRQIFAIGLNYKSHVEEVAMAMPSSPMIFTKFASAITGPSASVELPPGSVDWEVEMVAVIGRAGRNIDRDSALEHICAYCIGQDLSERDHQLENTPPQFSMAKSHKGFAPIGPWLTTADEIADPQNLAISCDIDGEMVQDSRTSMMLFDLPAQIAYLSSICELFPGDIIFTGTPEGVGMSRSPQRFLQKGETLTSRIESLGTMKNTFI